MYARKLIRSFANVKSNRVENEARAIAKLCVHQHKNIIHVFVHGKVPGFPYYFIDMELCDIDLASYLDDKLKSEVPAFRGVRSIVSDMRIDVWEVLNDITEGLIFIHRLKEIHRDLKPRNGTSYPSTRFLITSSVRASRPQMENRRFWPNP